MLGKVALVSLIYSNEKDFSADELAQELRRELESAPFLKPWVLDRVTVLDESGQPPKSTASSIEKTSYSIRT